MHSDTVVACLKYFKRTREQKRERERALSRKGKCNVEEFTRPRKRHSFCRSVKAIVGFQRENMNSSVNNLPPSVLRKSLKNVQKKWTDRCYAPIFVYFECIFGRIIINFNLAKVKINGKFLSTWKFQSMHYKFNRARYDSISKNTVTMVK